MLRRQFTIAVAAIGIVALQTFGASAQEELKIGMVVPLTGAGFAAVGKQVVPAARLYMKHHGDTVAGRKIQLIVRDDAGVADNARRIAQVSHEQENDTVRLSDRVTRIADIAQRNRSGAEAVTATAHGQAAALAGLEGATKELRDVAGYLGDLAERITSATSISQRPAAASRNGVHSS